MQELTKKPSYPIAAKFNGPGPGGIMLPSTVGFVNHHPCVQRLPAFSMRIALKNRFDDRSPGPAAYGYASKLTNNGLAHVPAFSIAKRHQPLKVDNSPGPAAYRAEDWRQHKSPAWHLALPYPKIKLDVFPAPNKYDIPELIGAHSPYLPNSPAFTMRIKPKFGSFTDDLSHSPAANKYDPVDPGTYKERAPAFTMRARRSIATECKSPGPAAYTPTLANRERTPAFVLGIRHSPYISTVRVPESSALLDWD